MKDVMQEAEALLGLATIAEKPVRCPTCSTSIESTGGGWVETKFATALRTCGPDLIRALMAQVKSLETMLGQNNNHQAHMAQRFEARIESLEAERDLWHERADASRYTEELGPWPNPTLSEIAARVEQKRKERTP